MVVKAPLKKPKFNPLLQNRNEMEGEETCETDNEVPDDIKIIAQEVQIVKSLACNDLKQRMKQMKRLRKWLQIRATSSFPFNQEDFMRIWKGLYYNMWYSDKPLVQEELAEQIGQLLYCFENNLQYSVDFFGAFLKTMCIEWFGIDQWRMDKFLMLTRRMLRYMLMILKSSDWSIDGIEVFNNHATETVLFENVTAKGLTMHYCDIFFEELAKVSEGNINAEEVGLFVKPFVKFMASQRDFNLISHCRTRVFYHLLYQSSLGRDYSEKYNAWKEMGFPTKHIDDLEKEDELECDNDVSMDNLEENEGKTLLDPRAGNVDVIMPELKLDAQPIIETTEYYLYKEGCPTKRRKVLRKLLDLFKTYQNGEFPLGIKTMPRFEEKSEQPLIKTKVKQLDNLENELYGVDRKLKQMTKRKRRKFLKSLNFDEIDESNYEQSLEKALPKEYLRERKKRSQKSFLSGWLEEELNENDLRPKKAKVCRDNGSTQQSAKGKNKLEDENSKINGSTEHVKKIARQQSVASKNKSNLKIKPTEPTKDDDISGKKMEKVSVSNDSPTQITPKPTKKEIKVLKISDDETPKKSAKKNEWDEPLAKGEVEYFLPSRKIQLKKANEELVLNPLAKQHPPEKNSSPVNRKYASLSANNTPKTPGSIKRVKIALKHNTSQNPIEYIQQIRSSPNIPYDAKKKPGKGLLKPNAMPSPINPFYKKKIGLKLLNDTL